MAFVGGSPEPSRKHGRQSGPTFGGSELAETAGLLHDIGKSSAAFQDRLAGCDNLVDHSSAGGQLAIEKYGSALGKMLAYLVCGHHGGLPNGYGAEASCLNNRVEKSVEPYENIVKKYLPDEIVFPKKFNDGFEISFFLRMAFSCLVDADYLDTEKYFDPQKQAQREGYPTLGELHRRLGSFLDELTDVAESTPVNHIRDEILQACIAAASKTTGLFSLTVPTGGGKTLSSLKFALDHAIQNGLRRVIYVIPYTSIIEQNAAVFRRAVGDESVLEHHSNFEPQKGDARSYLAAENWDAPLVVTTNVQFFESLFASSPSQCRKLHNIAGSVVIMDEAQMLPPEYLRPCLRAIEELSGAYKCSLVFCTATQPALERNKLFPGGLEGIREIVPNPKNIFSALKRVNVNNLGKRNTDAIAEELIRCRQVLCVVNTRRHAAELFQVLNEAPGVFHLSAAMCPAHRSQKLQDIRQKLLQGDTCRLVSTQLIEAGVDIDFPVVYRAMAGIDSIAQAAGRCNREGCLDHPGDVYVFDTDQKTPSGHLRQAADASGSVLRRHEDILGLDAVRDYFNLLYWQAGDRLDSKQILTKLEEGSRQLYFPFRSVAADFQFIPDGSETIIVPWDINADKLIRKLETTEIEYPIIRKLQRYTVQVYPHHLAALYSRGALQLVRERYNILIDPTFYRDALGLVLGSE